MILARAKLDRILEQDGNVRWNTPAGEKQMKLKPLITELEEQLGLSSDDTGSDRPVTLASPRLATPLPEAPAAIRPASEIVHPLGTQ